MRHAALARSRTSSALLPDAGELSYTCSLTPTAAEVLDAAQALPREQRAEVVQEIIATLGTPDIADEARLAALRRPWMLESRVSTLARASRFWQVAYGSTCASVAA